MPSTRKGIPTSHKTAVQVVTYLPTVLVVLLGIFWKRLIVDLKRIMPWACLSHTWVLGKNIFDLNYLDDLEFSLEWPAARRRHWALLIGLIGGLLSGVLVPLANALTFVDLAGQVTRPMPVRHDGFDFVDTLSNSNTSLALLKSSLGNMPWAGAANVLQSDGNSPAWTTDSFVFAPFHASGTNLNNHTLTADTTALTARFLCDPLQVNARVDDAATLSTEEAIDVADRYNIAIWTDTITNINLTRNNDSSTQSSQLVLKDPDSIIDPPVAWLNMSTSSYGFGTAIGPIQITLLQPLESDGPLLYWNGTSDGRLVPVRSYRGTGLSCTPMFYTYSARVSVNASNKVVTSYTLDNSTLSSAHITLSSDDIIGYLNNPLHPETIFGLSGLENQIEVQNDIQLGGGGNALPTLYTAFSGSDPFGTQLLDLNVRPVSDYFDNATLLEADASRIFATTMTQIIKAYAIANGTRTSFGEIKSVEALLRVQQPILRALEACLAILGVAVLCCVWPLRPRTCLSQDPGSLHFIASLIADNKALYQHFKIDGISKNNITRHSHFRLRQGASSVMHIDMAPAGPHRSLANSDTHAGYKPLQLRQSARWGLLSLLIMYNVVLGVVYGCGIQQGYRADSKATEIAWSFVPTTVLVLIGYAVSGNISAVQAVAPFAMLKTARLSGRRVMAFSPRNQSELTLPYHASFKMAYIPVLLTSLVALTYPAIKIVAADLYETFQSPQLRDCTVQLASPVFDFTRLAQTDGGTESRLRDTAAIRTDWVQLPHSGVQSQPNVIRNLIFQNVSLASGDDIADGRLATVELTALAVNMTCELFTEDMFSVNAYNGDFNLTFGIECSTDDCREKVPALVSDSSNKPYIAIQFADWYEYEGDPYSNANHRFYGKAGTLFTTRDVQEFIADFESLAGPVSNFSYIPEEPEFVKVSPGMFNVSMPTMRAVSYTPVLQNVRVNATIEKTVQAGLNGQSTTLPWAVTNFDPLSLRVVNELDISDPQVWRKLFPKGTEWGHSPFLTRDPNRVSVSTNWTNESEVNDDDIKPASGIASNFFKLLASYEQSQVRNATAVLDVKELASATIAVYGLYNAELLSHFRVATPLTSRDAQDAPQAQLHTLQARVRPNPSSTFAVIGMLSAVVVLLLLIFLTTASENVLLDKPGMIGTQLSLFAGSRIVEQLRAGDRDSVWNEKFSLGWWSTEDGGIRWGIDIGKLDASLQGHGTLKKTKRRGWLSSNLRFWRRDKQAYEKPEQNPALYREEI